MKYNGIDPKTLHPGISIAKEIPPGAPTSQLENLVGASGEIIAGRTIMQGEYIVRVNIGARTRKEAWEIREKLAAWACAADSTPHLLEPTHWPDRAYDAVLKEITPPEFVFGFAVVDVIFAVPRPIAHAISGKISSGKPDAVVMVKGTSYIRPFISATMNASYRATLRVDGKSFAAVNYAFMQKSVLQIQTDPPRVTVLIGNGSVPADSYVDYAVTDFDAMAKALTPGEHVVSCDEASQVDVSWKEEYL